MRPSRAGNEVPPLSFAISFCRPLLPCSLCIFPLQIPFCSDYQSSPDPPSRFMLRQNRLSSHRLSPLADSFLSGAPGSYSVADSSMRHERKLGSGWTTVTMVMWTHWFAGLPVVVVRGRPHPTPLGTGTRKNLNHTRSPDCHCFPLTGPRCPPPCVSRFLPSQILSRTFLAFARQTPIFNIPPSSPRPGCPSPCTSGLFLPSRGPCQAYPPSTFSRRIQLLTYQRTQVLHLPRAALCHAPP